MTDEHRRPSSAEIDVATLRANYRSVVDDVHEIKELVRAIRSEQIVIAGDLRVGAEKFRALDEWKKETGDTLEGVDNRVTELVRRVDAVEPNKPGMFGSVVGSLGFVGMGLWWGLHFLSKGTIPPPGDK